MEQTLWGHLPLLVRSNSKDSVEYILQSLWRTRKTGLDSADRHIIQDMLQLQNDSDLDPVPTLLPSPLFPIQIFKILINSPLTSPYIYTYSLLQLLVCLRMLIRRCVYENINRDEIHKLFPSEVLPELQRLLTLLLQKFQKEWREDALKDQVRFEIWVLLLFVLYCFFFLLVSLINLVL